MISALRQRLLSTFKERFNHWLIKRVPSASSLELTNKNIFIFPSLFGFSFLFIVLLLFLLGTNYQNNVIMLLCYVMASFFVTSMLWAFYNLKGLILSSTRQYQGFCEQYIKSVVLITPKKPCYDLKLCYLDSPITKLNQIENSTTIRLSFFSNQRGVLKPGRVKVLSEYPFGLFQVWAKLDFGHQFTVYPVPKTINHKKLLSYQASDNEGGNNAKLFEGDEFRELANFRQGDSMSRIAWKQFARGQGKLTKQYQQHIGESRYLTLDMLPNTSLEEKLKYLCYIVLQYHQQGLAFGLKLPHEEITIGIGDNHRDKCLTVLALYPHKITSTSRKNNG